MLRIQFEPQDIARVRLLAEPDPLWELVLSLPLLWDSAPRTAAHRSWQSAARTALASTPLAGRAKDLLSALVPRKGDFPDFLTPVAGRAGFDAGLDAIRALPKETLRGDLAAAVPRPPGWVRALADADGEARTLLELALREYYKAVVEPHWHTIRQHVAADQSARSRQATQLGMAKMLSTISPAVRWDWPVLEADYPCEKTVRLGGRGLVFIPSFFCAGNPVTFIDSELPPVLVYPALAPSRTQPREIDDIPALVNVLGKTRAHILLELENPCSTTELAARIGMSLASASHHTGLLREAGLTSTTRTGSSVVHELTQLGKALLDAPER